MQLWSIQCVALALLHHGAVRVANDPEPEAAEGAEHAEEHGMEVVHHDKVAVDPEHTDEPPPEGVGEHHPEGEHDGGHGEHGESGGPIVPEKGESADGHHAGEHASHPAVCILLYTTILLGPAVVLLANSKDEMLSGMTYRLLEAFITIFIAVQYFQAFDELLEVGDFAEHHAFIAAVLHLVFLFFLATIISWGVRRKETQLAVFTACGAHYVAFSACHTSGKLQSYFFTTLDSQPLYFLALFLGLAVIAAGMHLFRAAMSMTKAEKFEDSVDDLENDAIALCIGYSIAHTLDYVLSGEIEHFGEKHTPDQAAETGEEGFLQMGHGGHKTYAIGLMLLTSLLAAGMSAFTPKAKEHDGWMKGKALSIVKSAFVMTSAFTFLIGMEWVFHNSYPQHNETIKLFRDIVFAISNTVIALCAIYLMSVIRIGGADVRRTLPLAVGLAAAFAWEEVFDKAVDILAEEYHVIDGPNNDAPVVKVILALVSPLFLLPMYVLHIKPRIKEE